MLPSGECEDFCVTDLILSGKKRGGGGATREVRYKNV